MMDENREEIDDIELPFEDQEFNLGEWVYDHREGIYISFAIYLFIAILLLSVKISLHNNRRSEALAIIIEERVEEPDPEDIIPEPEAVEKIEQIEFDSDISNEAGEEDLDFDFDPMETERILNEAAELQQRLDANLLAYEQGLAEAQALREATNEAIERGFDHESESVVEGRKVSGNVAVSYIIINPIRHARHLRVPAYTCKGGGEVVIDIIVNRGGEVTSAKVNRGGDDCMQQAALISARASTFNVSYQASTRQMGRITYTFIPQ